MLRFSDINEAHRFLGGKAYNLAMLSQQNFPVPHGVVLQEVPSSEEQWSKLDQWWESCGKPALAVRSSASDEDNADVSFAGQNSSYLNVSNEEELKNSVRQCFASIHKHSSQAYRKHFLGDQSESRMNVLVQEMVSPAFAGVYFSMDPRGQEQGDLIEFVEGLGESLVSGARTPYMIVDGQAKQKHDRWREDYTRELRDLGKKVKTYLNKEIDIEWAIDHQGKLYLLQARPITANYAHSNRLKVITSELSRLKGEATAETAWDGQTFADWTGLPSFLTYSLYEKAFSSGMAFAKALKYVGYRSFTDERPVGESSVLERVMGRAYLNLEKLCPLYFGDIPYSLVPHPRPHLKFDARKISLRSFLLTPISVMNMLKVGWNLSSNRRALLNTCGQELVKFKQKMERPLDATIYRSWSNEDLLARFSKETHVFTCFHLTYPFVLTTLTESTLQSLQAITKNVFGDKESSQKIKHWMSIGLKTATADMNRYFKKACADVNKRAFFMARYGHRGPGELDLQHPRWLELDQETFFNLKDDSDFHLQKGSVQCSVEDEINQLKSFKKSIILQEWKLLKEMLELREAWKMEILKPFAHIRFICEELARRCELGSDFYLLSFEEILNHQLFSPEQVSDELRNIIKLRKMENSIFKLYSLPSMLTMSRLEQIIEGNYERDENSVDGESLSPGLVYGEVVVVNNIHDLDPESLTKESILVAESTDPGWTPLFAKVAGIVLERGGILSHAAIVAREMGIPAVSGIYRCTHIFKDGDRICLDGNNGHVSYES